MRDRLLALGLLAALGGCGAVPTSLDVKVLFDDGAHHPERLGVTVLVGPMARRMDVAVTAAGGRPLKSGDNFLVLLPDATDGQAVTVRVDTIENGAPTLHGEASATAARAHTTALTVQLGGGGDDGGTATDGGSSDGAADLAPPPPDLTPPRDLVILNGGPTNDVTEDPLTTWAVGESVNDTIEPCAPVARGRVALVAEAGMVRVGLQAVHVTYLDGSSYFQAAYPKGGNAGWDLSGRTGVDFFVNSSLPVSYLGWDPAGPTVILCGKNGAYRRLDPMVSLINKTLGNYVEAKVPLAGGGGWTATDLNGFKLTEVESIEFHVDPNRNVGTGVCNIWLDGVRFY